MCTPKLDKSCILTNFLFFLHGFTLFINMVKVIIDLWCHTQQKCWNILLYVANTFQNMLVLQILNVGFLLNQHSKGITKPQFKLQLYLALQREICQKKLLFVETDSNANYLFKTNIFCKVLVTDKRIIRNICWAWQHWSLISFIMVFCDFLGNFCAFSCAKMSKVRFWMCKTIYF